MLHETRIHTPATLEDWESLATMARPANYSDWGSYRLMIMARNLLAEMAEAEFPGIFDERFDAWSMKASDEEIVDYTMERIRERLSAPAGAGTAAAPQMGVAAAILAVVDYLETMDVPDDVRQAIATLRALKAQRGCQHFDPSRPDRLTDLCDLAIFG